VTYNKFKRADQRDLKFEWDEHKRERNIEKHGVDFIRAQIVFLDKNRIERLDLRKNYGEARFQSVGLAQGSIFFVVYTLREGVIRIISVRRAKHHEQKAYLYHGGSQRRSH
jgi:uncharacterized protein